MLVDGGEGDVTKNGPAFLDGVCGVSPVALGVLGAVPEGAPKLKIGFSCPEAGA